MYLYLKISHVIMKKHIIHSKGLVYNSSFFWLVYHVNMFDGEWIHETCLGKEVCNVLNLMKDISRHQFLGQ